MLGCMQWLFLIRPARPEMLTEGPTPEEIARVGDHFHYWKELTDKGHALVVGRMQTTDPDTLGLAIFRAPDESAARSIAEADPAVANGVFRMELKPYQVALLGDPGPFRP